ncbi:hypothetical protein DA89_1441 [Vibrio paracholerae]|nr:hypothetical protein DA89_1441 [Vibrio paracholerae]
MCLITTDPQGSPSQLTLLVNNQCSQITANRLILLAIFLSACLKSVFFSS